MLLGAIHLNKMLTKLRLKLTRFYFLDIKIFNTDGDMKGIFSRLFQQKPMMKALSTGSLMQSAHAQDGILPSGDQESKLLQDNSRSIGNLDFEMMGLDSPGLKHGFSEDLVQSQIMKTTKSEMIRPSKQTGGTTPRKVTNPPEKPTTTDPKSSMKPTKSKIPAPVKPPPTSAQQPQTAKQSKAKPSAKEKPASKPEPTKGPVEKKPGVPPPKSTKEEDKRTGRGANTGQRDSKGGRKDAAVPNKK